ncbi:unnamed protein product [Gadus morhua 'NCC']
MTWSISEGQALNMLTASHHKHTQSKMRSSTALLALLAFLTHESSASKFLTQPDKSKTISLEGTVSISATGSSDIGDDLSCSRALGMHTLYATAPVRVVVALDLTPQQFHQILRDNITGDNVDIKAILNSFRQDNLETGSTFTVIARRRYVLRSACAALSKTYFGWHKEPSVEFVSEMAADYGGPRREFFRLLMLEVQSSLGIFEGRPGELFFSYDLQALDQNKFYTAGKLTAWSIIHNGPGLRCLNNSLFALMCNQEVDLTNLDLGLLPIESDDQSKVDQIKTCSTEEDLATLKQVCGDWIAGCGVPTVYTANLQDLPRVLNRVVAHFIFHR